MLIDKPMTTVKIDGKHFEGETLKIVTIPESAGSTITYCHFLNFGSSPAIAIKSEGSCFGRVLFPNHPQIIIQNCTFYTTSMDSK